MRSYTVVIAGFKDTSRATLEAVLCCRRTQEVQFDVIFVDNTPDSRHREMVEQLLVGSEISGRYIPVTKPGKAAAQNVAVKASSSDYVVCLDDDVLPDRDLIVEYDRGFQLYGCGAVQGRVELQFEGCDPPEWFSRDFRLALAEMEFGPAQIPFNVGLTGASMAFRREMFTKHGLFDERLGPGRSGTLEDLEFSERIRAAGEEQLYWPSALVKHRIPPERLRIGSFCSICYDVGYSEFYLSGHMINGSRLRFTLWSALQIAKKLAGATSHFARRRIARGIWQYCLCWETYGYWRQAMRQI